MDQAIVEQVTALLDELGLPNQVTGDEIDVQLFDDSEPGDLEIHQLTLEPRSIRVPLDITHDKTIEQQQPEQVLVLRFTTAPVVNVDEELAARGFATCLGLNTYPVWGHWCWDPTTRRLYLKNELLLVDGIVPKHALARQLAGGVRNLSHFTQVITLIIAGMSVEEAVLLDVEELDTRYEEAMQTLRKPPS